MSYKTANCTVCSGNTLRFSHVSEWGEQVHFQLKKLHGGSDYSLLLFVAKQPYFIWGTKNKDTKSKRK